MTDIIEKLREAESVLREARVTIFVERKQAAMMTKILNEVRAALAAMTDEATEDCGLLDVRERLGYFPTLQDDLKFPCHSIYECDRMVPGKLDICAPCYELIISGVKESIQEAP